MAALYALAGAAVIALLVVTWLAAFSAGVRATVKVQIRKAGVSEEDVLLYRRAAMLLKRLAYVTELDGDFAADILSSETRKNIEEWIADYKEEINNNAHL